MAASKGSVTGGVDTHQSTHHAAVLDAAGRLLGDAEFPATAACYTHLLRWLRGFGRVDEVGVEGTGSYGAGLARYLLAKKVCVVEVDRPDRIPATARRVRPDRRAVLAVCGRSTVCCCFNERRVRLIIGG
jgi:transposase